VGVEVQLKRSFPRINAGPRPIWTILTRMTVCRPSSPVAEKRTLQLRKNHKIVVRNHVELQISMSVGQRGINYGVMEG
jgi:hypothetical protein